MTIYKVVFHPEAAKELSKMDNRLKILVLKQIKKLSVSPNLGKVLGFRQEMDLSGYRKSYADRKKIRIIYQLVEHEILIKIIAVGKREKMLVYKDAVNRIQE